MPHYKDMQTFQKTDKQIKAQIINWFLNYHRKSIDNFDGREEFTLFDKLSLDNQKVISTFSLPKELPVLVLKKDDKNIVVCTTRRFVYLENDKTQEIKYSDFKRHVGFKFINLTRHTGHYISVKTDGHISEFGVLKNDGQIVNLKIPTGHSGFAFWNITKKFEIIGRKYIMLDTK
jgi:hypothetical protein